jgi:tRNA threonylcarbamoyl adenosine modification protein YeaZ
MKILALEFSSAQRSIAVFDGALPASGGVSEVVETGPPPTKAFAMIEEVLKQGRLEREQVERLAIGIGPGSYSGIRSAIAIAQGWQMGRPVTVIGISSADCIAAQAQAEGILGSIQVGIDAQRKEFYLADYELDATGWRETGPLRLVAVSELESREKAGKSSALLVGPESDRFGGRRLFPSAATLARLAVARNQPLPANKIEPIYLRATTFVKAPPPRKLPS